MADLQGHTTYVNPALLSIYGYASKDEVIGKDLVTFWADIQEAETVKEVVLKHGKWQGEMTARAKDGSSFTAMLSVSLVTDTADQGFAIIASFLDISKRKQLEEKLAQQRKRLQELVKERTGQLGEAHQQLEEREIDFRYLIESNADSMVVTDGNGNVRFTNQAAESLLGERLAGKLFRFPLTPGPTEIEIDCDTFATLMLLNSAKPQVISETPGHGYHRLYNKRLLAYN